MAESMLIETPQPLCLLCLWRPVLVDEDGCCSCGGHVIAGHLGDIEAVEEALSGERASLEVLRGLLRRARHSVAVELSLFEDTNSVGGVEANRGLLAEIDAAIGEEL